MHKDEWSRNAPHTGKIALAAWLSLMAVNASLAILLVQAFVAGIPGLAGGLASVAAFLVLAFGAGHTLLRKVDSLELSVPCILLRVGAGLATLPLVFVVANTAGIPLNLPLFLAFSVVMPLIDAIGWIQDHRPRTVYRPPQKDAVIRGAANQAALLFGLLLLAVYLSGSFAYPWLEDGDPWQHAVGAKYVALKQTYSIPADLYVAHYLEPYPPGYDVLMGLLHQANDSVNWTLKFFNALLVALNLPLFYVFARRFTESDAVAVAGTFVLMVLPSHMTHFIWAHGYAILIFYPALYAVMRFSDDRRWGAPAAVMIASNMLVQPLANAVFGAFFALYVLASARLDRSLALRLAAVGLAGLMLSMLYWIPSISKFGADLEKINAVGTSVSQLALKIEHHDRTYYLEDLWLVPYTSAPIDQHPGIGFVLFPFFAVSLTVMIYALLQRKEALVGGPRRQQWMLVTVLWLLFSFLGLEGNELPVSVMPYKFWSYLAIPLALVCGYGTAKIVGRFKHRRALALLVIALLAAGTAFTSGVPKYRIETSVWPAGTDWKTHDHLTGYFLVDRIPKNAAVYPACHQPGRPTEYDPILIGLDYLSFPWDREVLAFREGFTSKTTEETHGFLSRKGYRYVFLDGYCLGSLYERNHTAYADALNERLELLVNAEGFNPIIYGEDQNFLVLELQDR